MSSKQFISAEEHLAKLGITVQQANDFIDANVGNPELLFSAARQNSVTNSMLNEITNIPTDIIGNYFTNAELDKNELDQTSSLINSDLGTLESLIDFNGNSGSLSNTSLSEAVKPQLNVPLSYSPTFNFGQLKPFYSNDEIYDAEELGVGSLVNVPANNESVESIFFGSLIKMFSALDESELNQINSFPNNDNSVEYQLLLLGALNESPSVIAWSDEQLAELVVDEAVDIINNYWESGNILVGVLDHSFLGLATA